MNKIESRCGIECSKCENEKAFAVTCSGSVNIENPFWGECTVKKCCENKGFENCGFCPDFSCELLNSFAYDEENGDEDGSRLEVCKKWCKR